MNPRVRFRQTLQPLLEELTISPVDSAFSSTGAQMDREFIHLEIEEDGTALDDRLRENGWHPRESEPGVFAYSLHNDAVNLILRTRVRKGS